MSIIGRMLAGAASLATVGFSGGTASRTIEGAPEKRLQEASAAAAATGILSTIADPKGAFLTDRLLTSCGAVSAGVVGVCNCLGANETSEPQVKKGIIQIFGGTAVLAAANLLTPEAVALINKVCTVGSLTLFLVRYGLKNLDQGNMIQAAAGLGSACVMGLTMGLILYNSIPGSEDTTTETPQTIPEKCRPCFNTTRPFSNGTCT